MPAWRTLWRDPLSIFLAVGGGFFLAHALLTAHRTRIEVTPAMQVSLAGDYEAMAGHRPDAATRARLVRHYVTDEILFREAIDRGMHLTDRAIKQRLIDRLRFAIGGTPAEPSEEQLINHYAENMAAYRAEPQLTFSHVYFARPPADPAAVLARLERGETVVGDEFWMGRDFPNHGQSMVRGMFGQPFLTALEQARPGAWFGPVRSIRGVHFVRLTGRKAAAMMRYTDVRDQVRQDYLAAQTGRAIDAEVAKLAKKYDVAIAR